VSVHSLLTRVCTFTTDLCLPFSTFHTFDPVYCLYLFIYYLPEADSLFLGNTVSSLMDQHEGLPVCQERVEEALRICAKFKARHQEMDATSNSWVEQGVSAASATSRTPDRQHNMSMSRTL
jgi:hypothetical protein